MNTHHRKRDIDPDLYFSDRDPSRLRKTEQLRAAIGRALTTALDCDVDDPELEELVVHGVLAGAGGSFAALFATARVADIDVLQERLRAAAPVFRAALARSLARKRVPQVSLHVVPAASAEEVDDE